MFTRTVSKKRLDEEIVRTATRGLQLGDGKRDDHGIMTTDRSLDESMSSAFDGDARRGCVYVSKPNGHRASYVELIGDEANLSKVIAPRSLKTFARLMSEPFVFFATVEDDVPMFLIVSQLRRMLGRPTSAILISPQFCSEPVKMNHYVRRMMFSSFSRGKNVNLISSIPHYIDTRFARYSKDWIYDPQFWDLPEEVTSDAGAPMTDLAKRALDFADGRPILLYLGLAETIKGFDFLTEIVTQHPELTKDVAVVAAGLIPEYSTDLAARIENAGVMIENRYISDEEVFSLKQAAACLWACYHPSYDQSSGLFGRAIQLGKSVLIRKGSRLAAIAEHIGFSSVACEYGDTPGAAAAIRALSTTSVAPDKPVGQLRQMSISRIRAAAPALA